MFYLGRFHEARAQLEQGIAFDEAGAATGDRCAPVFPLGESPGVVCRVYLARTEWLLGFPDRAIATLEATLALGQQLGDVHLRARALSFAAVVHLWRREFEAAQRQADAAIVVAREHSFSMWLGVSTMCRGVALTRLGHYDEGIAELRAGFADFQTTGARFFNPLFVAFTAEAHAAAGQIDAALAALDRAAGVEAVPSMSFYEAELHRLRGTLLIGKGDLFGGGAWLRRAIELAQSQGAKSLELRAATSLARLWRDQSRCTEARDLLAPAYNWFTEGFATPDLKDAQALLDELRG